MFIHVMKTAGTTFLTQFRRLFPADAVWPRYLFDHDLSIEERWEVLRSYVSLAPLLDMTEDERGRLSFVAGHLPFHAADILGDRAGAGGDLTCIALLRDPIERTISFLKQIQRDNPLRREQSLEAIYDDPWFFDRFIGNHQTRVFSMTLEEALAPRTDQLLLAELYRLLVPVTAPIEAREGIEKLIGDGRLSDDTIWQVALELKALGVDMTATSEPY
jgi:hypothetical protein